MRQLLRVGSPFVLLGCVHHAPEVVAPPVPSAPHLPAPVADLYIRHTGQPVDPLVTQVLGGRAWDEVLSGAASGLALTLAARGEVDLSAARWAAVRAGYPFQVLGVDVVHVAHEATPTLNVPTDGDLGLVRARGPDDDIWVVLHGAGGPDLPPVPREAHVGDFVPLSGATWRASSPDGEVRALTGGILLDRAGEWLLEARDAFVTIEIYGSFGRYALSQLKRLQQSLALAEHREAVLEWLREDPPPSLDETARRLADVVREGEVEP